MVPNYSTGIFKIHPYRHLKQKGEEVYSKPLYTCGNVWKLKVYPVSRSGVVGGVVGKCPSLCVCRMDTMKTRGCTSVCFWN